MFPIVLETHANFFGNRFIQVYHMIVTSSSIIYLVDFQRWNFRAPNKTQMYFEQMI